MTVIAPHEGFEYYTGQVYWNNFDFVNQQTNSAISGDASISWQHYVVHKFGRKASALVPSCGNGWVERELFQLGALKSVIGLDVIPRYVEEARAEAAKIGMEATYFVADANTYDPGSLRCDLVLNVGAMHHIAFINRLTARIAQVAQDGLYIGNDYTGPHRNQYPWEVWSQILEVNHALPEKYRQPIRYAHMPTMLSMDPSEAVHSELQIEVLSRHFDLLELKPLGGGIAYTVLFGNRALYDDQHTATGRAVIQMILEEDRKLLETVPNSNLFTFFVAKPRPTIDDSLLRQWQAEEDHRELLAAQNGFRYYKPTPLELIYNEFSDAEYQLRVLRGGR